MSVRGYHGSPRPSLNSSTYTVSFSILNFSSFHFIEIMSTVKYFNVGLLSFRMYFEIQLLKSDSIIYSLFVYRHKTQTVKSLPLF